MNKKAESLWISYVLLVAFVVALSAFTYSWMTAYTSDTSEEIKERVFNSELCDSLGVSVTACLNTSTSQDLYINVTNRGDLRITKLIFRLIQTSGSSVSDMHVIEIDSVIKPQGTKSFAAAQLNLTFEVGNGTLAEVVPVTEKEGFLIVCSSRKGEAFFRKC